MDTKSTSDKEFSVWKDENDRMDEVLGSLSGGKWMGVGAWIEVGGEGSAGFFNTDEERGRFIINGGVQCDLVERDCSFVWFFNFYYEVDIASYILMDVEALD